MSEIEVKICPTRYAEGYKLNTELPVEEEMALIPFNKPNTKENTRNVKKRQVKESN